MPKNTAYNFDQTRRTLNFVPNESMEGIDPKDGSKSPIYGGMPPMQSTTPEPRYHTEKAGPIPMIDQRI
jgi:hypothetical protein